MCTSLYVKTSPSPSLSLPIPTSCSPRATAKSSDITRMFQRRREPERGEGAGGREPRGKRQEDIAAASHAHMHKSVGWNASSYPARPHVVKRSRFLCLSLHKRRWRRQRGQAGDSFSRPVFFHFSHLVLGSKSVESLKSSQDFARACNKYEQECTGESLRKRT